MLQAVFAKDRNPFPVSDTQSQQSVSQLIGGGIHLAVAAGVPVQGEAGEVGGIACIVFKEVVNQHRLCAISFLLLNGITSLFAPVALVNPCRRLESMRGVQSSYTGGRSAT